MWVFKVSDFFRFIFNGYMANERLSKASNVVCLSQLCSDRSSIPCTRHSLCHAALRGPPRFLLALLGCGGGEVRGGGGVMWRHAISIDGAFITLCL